MDNVMLILYNIDNNPFINENKNNISVLYNYLDKYSSNYKIIVSYSSKEFGLIRDKYFKLIDGRENHHVIFSKLFSKNDENYNYYISNNQVRKNKIFKYIYKYISTVVKITDIIVVDNDIDINNSINNAFKDEPISLIKYKTNISKKILNYTK